MAAENTKSLQYGSTHLIQCALHTILLEMSCPVVDGLADVICHSDDIAPQVLLLEHVAQGVGILLALGGKVAQLAESGLHIQRATQMSQLCQDSLTSRSMQAWSSTPLVGQRHR